VGKARSLGRGKACQASLRWQEPARPGRRSPRPQRAGSDGKDITAFRELPHFLLFRFAFACRMQTCGWGQALVLSTIRRLGRATETDGPFAKTDGSGLPPWGVANANEELALLWSATLTSVTQEARTVGGPDMTLGTVKLPSPEQLLEVAADLGMTFTSEDLASHLAAMRPSIDLYQCGGSPAR
jgi:hypothetical protein